MASWQARFLSFLLRNTFKPRLARAKTVEQARAILNSGKFRMPSGVSVARLELAGVPAECIEPVGRPVCGILVYRHGGGYFACSAKTHRPFTTAFARRGFRVFAPDYRLAPAHPFPAGVEDAVAAWRAVRLQVGASTPVAIGGDSAGGGLVLATMLKLRAEGDILPAAAALFSPLTDLLGRGESRRTNNRRCAMFREASLALAGAIYLQGADPRDPLASPLYADLAGLPPLLIHVGSDETLRDDSTQLAERARAAGVRVELKIWPVVPHVWQLFHPFVPEGRRSLEEAAAFLENAAAGQGGSAQAAGTARGYDRG
jgi:monoterpene epsilon-lactone hydrolase